jgi:hypothetical protein
MEDFMSRVLRSFRCTSLRVVGIYLVAALLSVPFVARGQAVSTASAAVPRLVKFSGIVKDAEGNPRSGTVGITFALYKDEQGGTPLWLETQNAQIDAQGHYTVNLGATKSDGLPQELFVSGEARWLGVQPQGQAEQPRVLLMSVPYALKALDAETIGGRPASSFLLAPAGSSGSSPNNSPPDGTITGGGTANFVPVFTGATTIGNSKIFQTVGGNVGIGTTTPGALLDVKGKGDVRDTLTLIPKSTHPTLSVKGTAFAVSNTGVVSFVGGQTFPGAGTVTSVRSGAGLTGGPITGSGTLSIASAGVSNAMLRNPSLTVTANGPLNGGGSVALGGSVSLGLAGCASNQILKWNGSTWACSNDANSGGTITGVTAGTDLTGGGTSGNVTLNLDTAKVPQLNSANTFTASQSVTGNVTASGTVTGGVVNASTSFTLGGTPFAFGSFGNSNVFLGFAGNSTTTGFENTASGAVALSNNTSGYQNTAIGVVALRDNTEGNRNTAIGELALNDNLTGHDNTASGVSALLLNVDGSYNTADGENSLTYNTGSYNTALGYASGPDQTFPNLTNSTAIGAYADVMENNAMVLGSIKGVNNATADTNVGIGTTAPAFKLHIGLGNNDFRVEGPPLGTKDGLMASFGGGGDFAIDAPGNPGARFMVKEAATLSAIRVGVGTPFPDNTLTVNGSADKPGGGSWGTFSDGRLKTLHGTFNAGLSQILKLHPIRYRYKKENALGIHDHEEHIGFVAQDVQKVIPEAVTENDKGYLLVNNDPILWSMLNAIQQQQHEIAELRVRLRKSAAKDSLLESRLAHLEHDRERAANSKLALYQSPIEHSRLHK